MSVLSLFPQGGGDDGSLKLKKLGTVGFRTEPYGIGWYKRCNISEQLPEIENYKGFIIAVGDLNSFDTQYYGTVNLKYGDNSYINMSFRPYVVIEKTPLIWLNTNYNSDDYISIAYDNTGVKRYMYACVNYSTAGVDEDYEFSIWVASTN